MFTILIWFYCFLEFFLKIRKPEKAGAALAKDDRGRPMSYAAPCLYNEG